MFTGCTLSFYRLYDMLQWVIHATIECRKLRTLRWRHNDHAGVSNHQPHGCLLNRLFRRKSKKTSKLRFTGLCAGNSPGTGEFPAQMASYAENVSIWWRHHEYVVKHQRYFNNKHGVYPCVVVFYHGVIPTKVGDATTSSEQGRLSWTTGPTLGRHRVNVGPTLL